MAKRHQPSTIDRLPAEIREEIAALRRDNVSIDEILDHIRQLGAQVSRSALGRHVRSMADIGESMRRSQDMAKFVVGEFGQDPDARVARASMHLLQGAILEIITQERLGEDGQPVTLSAEEAKELSLSLQRLVTAQRHDAERQLKMRAEFAETAASAAETAMKSRGMSSDTIDFIRAAVLGTAE